MSKAPNTATTFHAEGLQGLSRNAQQFMQQHPAQAQIVVIAALEAAALQHESQQTNRVNDVPESLRPYIVERIYAPEMIGVSEAAEKLEISRTTVYDWLDKHILLGWRATKRGVTIPAEQILGPGKVVPGIAQLLEIIENPELVWEFLSNQWPFAADTARPIDKLKAGETQQVIDAANSFGTSFT